MRGPVRACGLLLTGSVLVMAAACGSSAPPAAAGHRAVASLGTGHALEHLDPTATPTPAPSAAATAVTAGRTIAPGYPLLYHFDAPSVGISIPVVGVGLTPGGAMDAPFGPPNSVVWHEGFWEQLTAHPGDPGTATLAGHLDDTLSRPGAFWTLRSIQDGATVTMTRLSDGTRFVYHVYETDAITLAQGNSPQWLGRIYGAAAGGAEDGTSRLVMITCTGRWVNGEYDHRFLAFASLVDTIPA